MRTECQYLYIVKKKNHYNERTNLKTESSEKLKKKKYLNHKENKIIFEMKNVYF